MALGSTQPQTEMNKLRAKLTLEQATKAQRGSRYIALFFL